MRDVDCRLKDGLPARSAPKRAACARAVWRMRHPVPARPTEAGNARRPQTPPRRGTPWGVPGGLQMGQCTGDLHTDGGRRRVFACGCAHKRMRGAGGRRVPEAASGARGGRAGSCDLWEAGASERGARGARAHESAKARTVTGGDSCRARGAQWGGGGRAARRPPGAAAPATIRGCVCGGRGMGGLHRVARGACWRAGGVDGGRARFGAREARVRRSARPCPRPRGARGPRNKPECRLVKVVGWGQAFGCCGMVAGENLVALHGPRPRPRARLAASRAVMVFCQGAAVHGAPSRVPTPQRVGKVHERARGSIC